MITVSHSIRIEAPADVVWRVTVDVERWPEWTPTVTAVVRRDHGTFGVGSVARLEQPWQPPADWTVTEFVPGERFAWSTRRRGLRITGSHRIVPEAAGTTSILTVEAAGALAFIIAPLLWPALRRTLSQENKGLKRHCEQIARAGLPHHPTS